MSRFDDIDFSALPAPDVVETLDYEVILAEMLTRFSAKADALGVDASATVLLESDPAKIALEVGAEMVVQERQKRNDAARAVLLATSTGADLDQVAARYKVARAVIDPGDPDAVPPVDPTYESDDSLRERAHLAYEALSVAGPKGAYIYHALSAHAQVKGAWAEMTSPGHILVTVLSYEGDGTPSEEVLAAVRDKIVPADVDQELRPDTDDVTVAGATIVHYTIEAELDLYNLPEAEAALDLARSGVAAYAAKQHKMAEPIAHSGLDGAMHVAAVREVDILSPAATLPATARTAYYCDGIEIRKKGDES
ncbi:MAG: baseplate J/gp47 family protein [Rhodospirillaceae bacterium]